MQWIDADRAANPLREALREADMITYTHDIAKLFRPQDVACMAKHDVLLADQPWMCDPANAANVYAVLSARKMPPDGPWPPAQVTLFKEWMDQGCSP